MVGEVAHVVFVRVRNDWWMFGEYDFEARPVGLVLVPVLDQGVLRRGLGSCADTD